MLSMERTKEEPILRGNLRAVVQHRWRCHQDLRETIAVHARICQQVKHAKSSRALLCRTREHFPPLPSTKFASVEFRSLLIQLGLARRDLLNRVELRSVAEDLVAEAIAELESQHRTSQSTFNSSDHGKKALLLQAVGDALWHEQVVGTQLQIAETEQRYAQQRGDAAYTIWQSERVLDLGTAERDWARVRFEEAKVVSHAANTIVNDLWNQLLSAEYKHYQARVALKAYNRKSRHTQSKP